MKKLLWSIIGLIMLNTVNAASTSILQVSDSVTGITPGKTGVITLSLTNAGTDISYDTKIVLTSIDEPLTSQSTCNQCIEYSESQKVCKTYKDYCYQNTGDIYGTNGQEAVFRVNIPENVETGTYVADFVIHYNSKNVTTRAIEERILNKKVVLEIESLNVKPDVNIKEIIIPEEISPGDEFNLTIRLENNGELTAQELSLNLESNELEVKRGTNNQLIGDLLTNEEENITYTMLADASLPPGVYGIELTTNYTDNEEEYTKTTKSGLLIDGKADFNLFIQDISPDIIRPGEEITVFISVANTGILDAKSVSIQVNPCSDIELGNFNEDFLGDLDSGDFTSTSFSFTPASEGEAKISLTTKYTTPNGEKAQFNSTERLIIRYSQATTTNQPILNYNWLIYTVLGIIIFVLYKKTKNKK